MKTTESIQQLHDEMQHARERVLALTGMRENDLTDMVLDGGQEWLKLVTHENPRALEFMPRTREFWSFWRKTWHELDLAFIDLIDNKLVWSPSKDLALFYYHQTHRISLDNINVNNRRVFAHYHMLRSMVTYMKP